MSMWQDYLARVQKDLEQLRADLAPLVGGEMKLRERLGNGEWRDVTQDQIDHLNRVIDTYERIAEAIRKRVPF